MDELQARGKLPDIPPLDPGVDPDIWKHKHGDPLKRDRVDNPDVADELETEEAKIRPELDELTANIKKEALEQRPVEAKVDEQGSMREEWDFL